MPKIKFSEDIFITNSECIEKDTIMNLKENKDHFAIYSNSGYIAGTYDYSLKNDIYKYFEIMD
ncbi:hypothetical protein [Clostridium rectalis]|uniref:hypothetical protein n=1 Tax=Clostridium rectalis TaxID=2040295 RepID=UPI000F63D52D|nr:hypothetical protein [Clostridium rectalis]